MGHTGDSRHWFDPANAAAVAEAEARFKEIGSSRRERPSIGDHCALVSNPPSLNKSAPQIDANGGVGGVRLVTRFHSGYQCGTRVTHRLHIRSNSRSSPDMASS